jgi:Tfp pilus assembly protein PilE
MGALKHFSSQQSRHPEGLTYVEIMVSMMISALFLSTTLQAYIAATAMRVRTQEVNAAIASIQTDTEVIRQIAQVSPKFAKDCYPSSGSYAQQLMSDISKSSSIEQRENQSVIQQTLPMSELSSDYELRRTLSIDKRELPAVQVLKISYKVLRHSAQSQIGNNPQSDRFQFQTETLIAQQNTSILPNAALVCFF